MKVFISVGEQAMSGYTNIDPSGGENKISMDFRCLDSICEASQCMEICAPNITDYLHHSEIMPVINNWVSKLRHGGTIIIGGSDSYEICKGVVNGKIDTIEFNVRYYGNSNSFPFIKTGMYTRHDVESILVNMGLKIVHKRINDRCFVVEAIRD